MDTSSALIAPERVLRFFHSSPGTGTRVASIPLGTLPDFEKAFLAFSWSSEEVIFAVSRGE